MARDPDAPRPRRRVVLIACVMLATIMQALDTTIANVALPYMQGSLSATQDQVNWVLTSYIVASAIMTPPTGWFADRFGRRRVLLIAIGGFVGTSMLCGLAGSIGQMVVFRMLQGAFGAPLVPLAQAVLLDSVPRERYGRMMAIWGIGVMVGPIVGPTLGGILTEAFGLMASLEERRIIDGPRFAWFGFSSLAMGVACLQLMLDRGQRLDWLGSPEIIAEAALALLGMYLFVVHMATSREPFLSARLFRDRNFLAGTSFIFIIGMVLLANMALMAPFLQTLLGYPVLTAGLALSPRGFGTIAAMLIVGRIINRVHVRWLILFGLVVTAISLHEMTRFSLDVSMSTVIWTGVIQGFGLGFVFVPLSTVAFSTLPDRIRTQGTAFYSLMRNVGSSVGISVVVALLSRNEQVVRAGLVEHVTAYSAPLRRYAAATPVDPSTPVGLATLEAQVDRQAALVAYLDDFEGMMVLTILSMPLVLLFRQRAASGAPTPLAAS